MIINQSCTAVHLSLTNVWGGNRALASLELPYGYYVSPTPRTYGPRVTAAAWTKSSWSTFKIVAISNLSLI